MPPTDSPKRNLASRLFQKLGGQPDLGDDNARRDAGAKAVDLYLEEYKRSTYPPAARAVLDSLADKLREGNFPTIDLYRQAYARNKGDTELLRFIVEQYDAGDRHCREAVEAFWALTVAEPSELGHYLRLVNYYRDSEDPLTLLKIEEQIVERHQKIARGELPQGRDPKSNQDIYDLAVEDLAATYADMGRADKQSAPVFERQLELNPGDSVALEMVGRCYAAEGRQDQKALSIYEAWFVTNPQDPKLNRLLIDAYQALGNQEQALVLMEHCYQLEGESNPELLASIVQYYRGRHVISESSIRYFKRYAEQNRHDKEIHRLVARFYAIREATSAEAAAYYEKAIGNPPADWVFRHFLSRHYLDQERWLDVYDLLDPLRGTPLMRGSVLMGYAAAMARLDRLDAEAAYYYQSAIAAGSRSRAIHTALCRAYIRLKRLDHEAFKAFEETSAIDPENPWCHFGMAAYYFRLEEPRNALRHAAEHLRRNPGDEAGRRLAGMALANCVDEEAMRELGPLSDAVRLEVLLAASKESPLDARLLLPLARAFHRAKRMDEKALAVYESLLAIYPDDVAAREDASRACYEQGREEEGLAHARRLAMMAGHAELRSEVEDDAETLRAVALAALRKVSALILDKKVVSREEENVLKLALRNGGNDPLIYRRLALSAAERNEFGAETLPIYENALKHYPELVTLKHLLMRCFIAIGDAKPVLEHARELLESQPYNRVVLSLLIDCLSSTACYDEDAHDLICEQARQNDDDDKTMIAYALFNYRANRSDAEAARVYERAIAVAPNDLKVMLLTALARCCEEIGKPEAALMAYEQIVGIIPSDLDIIKRLALNYVLHGATDTRARDVIRQALTDGPYDLELYLFLADVFINRDEVQLTQYIIDRVQDENPDAIGSLIGLLEKAARLGMSGPAMVCQLAEYYYLAGDRARALAVIDELGDLTPRQSQQLVELYNIMLVQNADDMEARRRRGELLSKTDDKLSAVEDLVAYWEVEGRKRPLSQDFIGLLETYCESAKTIDPFLAPKIARSFHRVERHADAIKLCQQALNRDRNDVDARLLLGRCLLAQGELTLALRSFAKLPPTDAVKDNLYRIACELADAREYDDAAEAIRCVVDHDPEYRDCSRRETEIAAMRKGRASDRVLLMEARSRALPPRARERFDLVAEIGSSPLAAVYKAYDRELDELVALKILSPAFSNQPEARQIFRSQARAMRRLGNPHIVRIREIGDTEGLDYISMDFFPRGNLSQQIRNGLIPPKERLQVARQIAEALDYAHRHEVIHRGVKPSNILVNDFQVAKLSDLGFAAVHQRANGLSPDIRMESQVYMAPEFFRGGPPTPSTDMYCYAVAMYELFAGKPPFTRGNLAQLHLAMKPKAIEGVPARLSEVLLRALGKKPEDRYPTMRELVADLQSVAM